MPDYRRPWVPGATYFVTIVTYNRRRIFVDDTVVALWRDALAQTISERPCKIVAAVILHDHMHLIIQLPPGDADLSSRVGRAKALFTKRLGGSVSAADDSRRRHRESDVWQRRFFDHMMRDETDFVAHMDYLHYNPAAHGYVKCPSQWPWSSFHRWVEKGAYVRDWGCPDVGPPPDFAAILDTVGE